MAVDVAGVGLADSRVETGSVSPVISATEPEWEREMIRPGAGDIGRHLIRCVRRYQSWRGRRGVLAKVMRKYFRLKWRVWSVITASEVALEADLGGGLLLPHPQGVIIHPQSKVGPNCLLFQHVTLGMGGPKPGCPTLGGHVDVGCGAKLLGGIHVGDHAKIGANAVVLIDVPAGRTAVGIPARIV